MGSALGGDMSIPERPNFLIIQCDDLGFDDLGCRSSTGVHTPNLDQLAQGAFLGTDFTVHPVCAPSRATFLTGRHFLKTGVSHVHGGKDFLHPDEITLAERFQKAGYQTGMWGKWHLGHSEGYFPWQRGFDEAYMADLYRHRHSRGRFNGEPVEHSGWADAITADYLMNFLKRHRDHPFFAYWPTLTPHTPHDAPEPWVEFHLRRGASPGLAVNRAMVSFLDEQIGRVLAALDELGLAGNTPVLFMSDHGPAYAGSQLNEADRQIRNSSGRRGWKGDLYENGVQSPLMIRWPGGIEPRHDDTPLSLPDLAPTLLDLAGAIDTPMEGRNLKHFLCRKHPLEPRDVFNYAHRGWLTSGPPYSLEGIEGEYAPGPPGPFKEQSLSLRRGYWKLIQNPEFDSHGTCVLYNLKLDPGEQLDLSRQEPERVEALRTELFRWWEEVTAGPHAFHPPVFFLHPGENILPGNAPSRLEGSLCNTVVDLRGWNGSKDCAWFTCNAPVPLTATIEVTATRPAIWELSTPAGTTRINPDDSDSCQLPLPGGTFRLQVRVPEPTPTALKDLRLHLPRFENSSVSHQPAG